MSRSLLLLRSLGISFAVCSFLTPLTTAASPGGATPAHAAQESHSKPAAAHHDRATSAHDEAVEGHHDEKSADADETAPTAPTEPEVVENEVTQPFTEMPLDQLQKSIEKLHPAAYYTLASRLFTAGKKDEAVFWFYLGQLRYRYHLAVHTDLDPTGDPALFASLSEVVGAPINQYAFGNIAKLTETLDRVLIWDQKHVNGFCAKDDQVYPTIRKGLEEFREYIREHEVMIQIERKKNGLE